MLNKSFSKAVGFPVYWGGLGDKVEVGVRGVLKNYVHFCIPLYFVFSPSFHLLLFLYCPSTPLEEAPPPPKKKPPLEEGVEGGRGQIFE